MSIVARMLYCILVFLNNMERLIRELSKDGLEPVKVLHMPCNTPYVKKLHLPKAISIINGDYLIPNEITYQWILDHHDDTEFWRSFDVTHMHYGFEFEPIEIVKSALALFKKNDKPIVYTFHEMASVHGISNEAYQQYVQLIFANASEVITLSTSAQNFLTTNHSIFSYVIPHGAVTFINNQFERDDKDNPEVLFFGSLRSNRETATSLINVLLGTNDMNCRVSLVTRPFTSDQLANSPVLRTAVELMCRDVRAKIELTLPLSDDDVAERVRRADIIVLPYTNAGHSGQLELAFDCGTFPVITNVGFLESQIRLWPNQNETPYASIVNWNDGKTWLYQSRLVQAVRESISSLPQRSVDLRGRATFRTSEHSRILSLHHAIYNKALNIER